MIDSSKQLPAMGQLALTRQLQFGVFGWAGFCITEWLWFDIITLTLFMQL